MVQTALMYFFSPMCNGVWRKPGTAKHCEDHAAEMMSMQQESV